jgi:hypothetical protein
VQVVVRDQVELGEFIRGQVRTLPGVIDTRTIPETVVHKLWFEMPDRSSRAASGKVMPLRSSPVRVALPNRPPAAGGHIRIPESSGC